MVADTAEALIWLWVKGLAPAVHMSYVTSYESSNRRDVYPLRSGDHCDAQESTSRHGGLGSRCPRCCNRLVAQPEMVSHGFAGRVDFYGVNVFHQWRPYRSMFLRNPPDGLQLRTASNIYWWFLMVIVGLMVALRQ